MFKKTETTRCLHALGQEDNLVLSEGILWLENRPGAKQEFRPYLTFSAETA